MYKPISYNVIRQAIDWSDLPAPQKIRMLSTFKWPNGDTSGEYMLTFDGAAVREALNILCLWDGAPGDVIMRDRLQQCFCRDIVVVRSWCDPQHDLWKCELYGRVQAHLADNLTIPLFQD